MSVEIVFPLEFIVRGTPASLQTKRPQSRAAWRDRIRAASQAVLHEGHFATTDPLAVTLFYFPDEAMRGDIDNIVKPILDALCQHVYIDDRQVERVWVQKFEPDRGIPFQQPSGVLAEAVLGVRPLLFVRLTTDLTEGLP